MIIGTTRQTDRPCLLVFDSSVFRKLDLFWRDSNLLQKVHMSHITRNIYGRVAGLMLLVSIDVADYHVV
jgi:hypothetical protein